MRIEQSSGNVFADLGLPDAAELDTKVRLAVQINRLIKDQEIRISPRRTARAPGRIVVQAI